MQFQHEFDRLSGTLFVEGQYVKSKSTEQISVIDPATEDRIAEISSASEGETDDVMDIANAARNRWLAFDPRTRSTMLHEVAARIRRDKAIYGYFMTREEGKPFKESVDETSWCATAIDYYAELGRHDAGRVAGTTVPGQFHYSIKEPLGTVVIILPFNFPLVLMCWELAAALAAGNSVIVKPHEQTTITTLKFMEVFTSLPKGLVQVVTGGPRVAQQLVRSRKTHCIAYTGSVPIAQEIMRACSETFKPVLIEASGNDPFIVMPSAPLDVAARAGAFAAYLNCGQVCTSAERFYVHQDIHDEFVERMVVEAKRLRIGNGLDAVDIGPMATSRQRDRFEALLSRARLEGAKFATGGNRPASLNRGWFVEPSVLTNVSPDSEILNGESFGPVAPICKVASFEEALMLANRSDFGLGATLYSRDMREVMRAVNEIEAGMVWVNAPVLDNDALPFGGRKMSGVGRQLGPEGLAQFQSSKWVMIDPEAQTQDFWWFPYAEAEAYKMPSDNSLV
ncbi:betaine-aldehyde dehydrogenase [Mesorhizobium sp. YL-MeA3-2017]|uniref:aldehyde dehydrogenase family protein n=1 Tax=Mesorhizobium sp. YL-MeA3-2017 TaxID=3042284 RepID=UPI0015CA9D09|nr:aldehyde dehydrogenase family protein [Mesorhizobium sp. YL-MeA3-2017]MDQ0332995.1 betaine-aldehyde dehydrogenase [Mesorhizobium sp. YL-MeA3-2017]